MGYVGKKPSAEAISIGADTVLSSQIADGAILNTDINSSAAINATKIADGSVTSAEFQYINTLSSNAQTQLNSRITGTGSLSAQDLTDIGNLSGTNTGDQTLPTDFVSKANGGTFTGQLQIDHSIPKVSFTDTDNNVDASFYLNGNSFNFLMDLNSEATDPYIGFFVAGTLISKYTGTEVISYGNLSAISGTSGVDTILKVENNASNADALVMIDSSDNRDSYIRFMENGTTKWQFMNDGSDSDKLIISDDGNAVLTLDQSQNATFGGDVIVSQSGDGDAGDVAMYIKKGNSDSQGVIKFQRGSTLDWSIGYGSGQSGDPYHLSTGTEFGIWNGSTPTNVLKFVGTAATFAGNLGIGGTSADANRTISSTTTGNEIIYMTGDSGGANKPLRVQIDNKNDFVENADRIFIGDGGCSLVLGTSNSSFTPTNSYIAMLHNGSIKMGSGSGSNEHLIINTNGKIGINTTPVNLGLNIKVDSDDVNKEIRTLESAQNWYDSTSNSVWGWGFYYDENLRGGIAYDHRSTEEMNIWSAQGPIVFNVDGTSPSGNEFPSSCSVESLRLTAAGNAEFGGDVTITGNIIANGNILGDGATELGGGYPSGQGIKRIHMGHAGAEIVFGDVSTTNPLGITEGAWNTFTDTDRLGIYARNELKLYGYNSGASTGTELYVTFVRGLTTFAGDIAPSTDSTHDLGSSGARWANVYTGDLHLKNEVGDWTVKEGEEELYLINNLTNKKYSIMMKEVS